MNPNMKARISQLYKTEAEWNSLNNFIPLEGEVVVFAPDTKYNYARLKMGDGKTLLKELPFMVDTIFAELIEKYRLTEVIDAGRITEYK